MGGSDRSIKAWYAPIEGLLAVLERLLGMTPVELPASHDAPVQVREYSYQQSGTFALPALPADQISITLTGGNTMTRLLNGRREHGTIHSGDLTIVPRGSESVWMPQIVSPGRVIHLLILPELWHWAAEATRVDACQIELRAEFATPDGLVQQLALALAHAATTSAPQIYAQTLQQALMLHLIQNYSTRPANISTSKPAHHRFRRSLDYMDTHLADDIALETLAHLESMSVFHFVRLFRAEVGLPPHQYLIARRVERACYLLQTTALPIAAIAHEVGFANQSHLTRHFKRIVGVTPGQYRP